MNLTNKELNILNDVLSHEEIKLFLNTNYNLNISKNDFLNIKSQIINNSFIVNSNYRIKLQILLNFLINDNYNYNLLIQIYTLPIELQFKINNYINIKLDFLNNDIFNNMDFNIFKIENKILLFLLSTYIFNNIFKYKNILHLNRMNELEKERKVSCQINTFFSNYLKNDEYKKSSGDLSTLILSPIPKFISYAKINILLDENSLKNNDLKFQIKNIYKDYNLYNDVLNNEKFETDLFVLYKHNIYNLSEKSLKIIRNYNIKIFKIKTKNEFIYRLKTCHKYSENIKEYFK